jgi:beta-xylosidase
MNPVIPGDHPDCTLTKIGQDFYTTGSSFNPTPVIYHSTDLVHWEAVAQPVSAAWSNYGDSPSGGCWGGQVVYFNNKYWYFFSRNNTMHFTTADNINGSWTLPTQMKTPAQVPGLGYDNSIFIDDDGSWYLLVKNGQVNNWIVQLGNDGQPAGKILDLRWLNPAPTYPFSWAEGPVMWKYKGNYYYSFARNVAGGQKVFKSSKLTDDQNSWVNLGDLFYESDPRKWQALFQNPNHSSAAIMLDDSTSWVVHPLWRNANNNEWYGQGRQGLLNQVRYDAGGKPTADYPVNEPLPAPKLPSSGIPWMVPHSDFFTSDKLNHEWSFLGYTQANTYSLTKRNGWFTLSPRARNFNTIIKNDGEHNYSLITKLSFDPATPNDQAGIWIFNGLQTLFAKLYCSVDSSGNRIVGFSYKTNLYQAKNPLKSGENILLLKLVRVNHKLSGYFSKDGYSWEQVGTEISIADMDGLQPNYNAWTGNRQGLFVLGASADFDYYIYRDAYTPILAECPANQYGTTVTTIRNVSGILDNIHDGDWALYAGVEFGNNEYVKKPDSLYITASSANAGGVVEVWLDSLDSKSKIAECKIGSTGSWETFETFKTKVLMPVSGKHDIYLRFKGTGTDKLFAIQWINFINKTDTGTSVEEIVIPSKFSLEQNYPNPFNPVTTIRYTLQAASNVSLKIYDILGREVATLVNEYKQPGNYKVVFNPASSIENPASGICFYRLTIPTATITKKMLLVK